MRYRLKNVMYEEYIPIIVKLLQKHHFKLILCNHNIMLSAISTILAIIAVSFFATGSSSLFTHNALAQNQNITDQMMLPRTKQENSLMQH